MTDTEEMERAVRIQKIITLLIGYALFLALGFGGHG